MKLMIGIGLVMISMSLWPGLEAYLGVGSARGVMFGLSWIGVSLMGAGLNDFFRKDA